MLTKMYAIEGMSCENCVSHVKSAFKNRPEVIDAQVILTNSRAIVSLKEELPIATINAILKEAGHYSATEIDDSSPATNAQPKKKAAFLKIFQRKKACCR